MPSAARSAALSPWRVSGTQGSASSRARCHPQPGGRVATAHAPRATVSLVAPDAIRSPVRPAIASFRESRGADVVQAVTLGFEWKRLWWEQRDPPRLGVPTQPRTTTRRANFESLRVRLRPCSSLEIVDWLRRTRRASSCCVQPAPWRDVLISRPMTWSALPVHGGSRSSNTAGFNAPSIDPGLVDDHPATQPFAGMPRIASVDGKARGRGPRRRPVCRGWHRPTGRRGAGVGRGTLLDAKDRLCLGPVAFEPVIVALRGREDVHDDAAEVEQDPVRRGGPLAADRANAVGPQPVHDPVADRLQLAL